MKKNNGVTVSPFGPIDAEVCLVGEAPARQEVLEGRPFVGSAGRYLTTFLLMAGLNRSELRITNVSQERAPRDKMANLPQDRLSYWTSKLYEDLNAMPNLKIVVAMGNYALEAMTGRHGIEQFRGSPMIPVDSLNQNVVVVPTIHPSSVHYNYEVWPLIVADFIKIKKMMNEGFSFPTFNFILNPTLDQVVSTLKDFEQHPNEVRTIDIETPHNILTCVGIGWSRQDAICIPFVWGGGNPYWTAHEEELVWRMMADILPKLNLNNQNFMFDWEVLARYGIHLKIPEWDPMLMHHCLYSDLPHRLDTIASIYTDIAFYKRDEREDNVKGSALRAGKEMNHWNYNAMDCCAAWWCIEELKKELISENMMDVYHDLYVNLFNILLTMNIEGVNVDLEKLHKYQQETQGKYDLICEELKETAGHEVNPNSSDQVKTLLLDELGMVGYKDRRSGKVSMNEKNLKKLSYKYQTDIPLKIIEARKYKKALGLFCEENLNEGRICTRHSLGRAKTGRLSSKKAVGGKGMNMQNVKDSTERMFFIPDDGHVFIGADQKAAEACIVAWLSKDPNMIAAAESGQIHFRNAENLFQTKVTKQDNRYRIAKSLVHAGNYDIGIWEFARTANLPYGEAKTFLALYHNTYPGIRDEFHRYVINEIKRCRTLYNPFGRRLVLFGRMDRETYKLGYAFLPQSTSSDINKHALKRIAKKWKPKLELHDGLIIQVPKDRVDEGIVDLKEAYKVEFKIWGIPHIIKVDISIGDNWLDMQKVG